MNKDRRTCKRLFASDPRNENVNADDVGLVSKHGNGMVDAGASGLEVKRMRDSQELDAQNQLLLTALTSSFLDNPGDWFAHTQEGRVLKSRAPATNKSGRGRGASRRSRYMRASPKPLTSLESCLRAQLDLDEKKSASAMFQPAAAGLRQVASLGSAGSGAMVFGTRNVVARDRLSKRKPGVIKTSADALLFSFGVGLGVMHTTTASSQEMANLQSRLDEAEKLVRDLQIQASKTSSGNMAELEAQLEAELELMLDNEDIGEVVHDQLTLSGLPGASDLEDERNESRNGETGNWAVSPRELDKRLRLLLETQQEERIASLEEQLEHTQTQLHDREEELQLWKERVRLLTRSGQAGGEQSPSDDICDEFLKSVDVLLDSDLSSNLEMDDGVMKKEENSNSVWKWKYSGKFNAGAATPLDDVFGHGKSQLLLNTPRRPKEEGGATVVDKIRYWENVSKGRSFNGNQYQQNPEQEQERQQQSPSPILRLSCSEVSSSSEGGEDDDESWMSDVEEREVMRRIVEKSRKGSTLLRDVEVMLAALDCDSA